MPPDPRRPISAERSPWLRGTLSVPGDAILTHLALLAAAVARGESVIAGGLRSTATAALERAVAELGVYCERTGTGALRVHGLGVGGLLEPATTLEFGGSSLGVTLTMGLVGGHAFSTRFAADPEVSSHPRAALLDGLRAFGCSIEGAGRGRLPITLHGPEFAVSPEIALPPAEPATKAALLLTALGPRLSSTFIEPAPGWNHAERLLRRFGAQIGIGELETGGRKIVVEGRAELRAQPVDVPADPSLAALGAAAAAIVPGSEVTLPGVLLNPARTPVLSALMAMGAGLEIHGLRREGEEEVGDIVVRSAPLRAVAFAAHHVAPLIRDLPLLAVVAAFAEGQTAFMLPEGLPLLQHARLKVLSQALAANGVRNQVTEEAVVVAGARSVAGGARLDLDDAGIALAMLVLGMGADRQVTLAHRSVIKERFPGFVEAFEAIGASFVVEGPAR